MERREQAGRTRSEKVLNCLYQNPDAVVRLICFPWAGGGSIYFAKWGEDIHNSLEVLCVRLAGRESRLEEPFVSDINQVVEEIAHALLPVIQDKPFAFFGHSMGCYVAFRTAMYLKEKYKLEPLHFFVSSATPLHSKNWFQAPKLHELSEEQIISHLVDFGGTPKSLIEDKELLRRSIPMLLADVKLVYYLNLDAPAEAVLSCDLTCFVGSNDLTKDIEAWKDVTTGTVDTHVLPGDHFYLLEYDNEKFLKNYVTKCLELSLLT